MGAENQEEGQSIIEFLFMLPLMIGITVMMVKVNTAIQMSIVNQKYARAQALFLAFNSPEYPSLSQRQGNFVRLGTNQMVIGVSDNVAPDPEEQEEYVPEASTQSIIRPGTDPNLTQDPSNLEPDLRDLVRVRTTVALCTQDNFIQQGSDFVPIQWAGLPENYPFQFCRSQEQ